MTVSTMWYTNSINLSTLGSCGPPPGLVMYVELPLPEEWVKQEYVHKALQEMRQLRRTEPDLREVLDSTIETLEKAMDAGRVVTF